MTVGVMISTMGDLGHDNVNVGLVGRVPYHLDCEEQRQCNIMYSNPKALREVDYTDTLTDVNFTDPVFADNQQSAIDNADITK